MKLVVQKPKLPDIYVLLFCLPLLFIAGCHPASSPNGPPTAIAGADQTVNAGANVTLDGSASSGLPGAALGFSWRQIVGTPVSLSSTTAAAVTFTAPANGTALVFELTVSAGQSSSTDAVGVSVLPIDSSAQVVQFRPSMTIRDDPAVQGNLPPSFVVERPSEAPTTQKEGGAYALLGSTQFAPLAEVQLAPGAIHEVELQVAGPSVLLGSAKWIGTPDLLGLSVSFNGASLANGTGFPSGPDRGLSTLAVETTSGGLATLSISNTSLVTVSVRIVFGAIILDLLE